MISGVSQRIATGDLSGAAAIVPELPLYSLSSVYGDAFQVLMHVLTGVTLFAALAAFCFLGKASGRESQGDLD